MVKTVFSVWDLSVLTWYSSCKIQTNSDQFGLSCLNRRQTENNPRKNRSEFRSVDLCDPWEEGFFGSVLCKTDRLCGLSLAGVRGLLTTVRVNALQQNHVSSPQRSSGAGRWAMVLVAGLLVAAMGLVLYGEHRPVTRRFHGRVADLLPAGAELPGWTVQDQPVADTPEMQKRVGELLNFDDAVYRIYERGGDRFAVYIAYWTPGKMSQRLVAGHTPDVCWVASGWRIEVAASGVKLGGEQTLPAEERTMAIHDTAEYVVFWHRLDDQVVSYRRQGLPPWYAAITDLWRRGFDQRQEQFFVRVSSNRPVDEWPRFELYPLLLQRLPVRRAPPGSPVEE